MRFPSRAPYALSLVLCACKGTEAFVATPTSIALTPATISFGALAATRQVTATVLDQRGDPMSGATVVWSSDNPAVAGVNASGLVTAQTVGSTRVRATVTLSPMSLVDSASVTVTQVPAQFVKFAGDVQIDTVAGTLPTPITVQVTDSTSHPIAGIIVTFAVTGGGGHVSSGSGTTDATGRAAVQWTLGGTPGSNSLSAAAAIAIPGSPATFTASGVAPGSRSSVAVKAGDGQHGLVGARLNFPPAVVLKDGAGTPIAGKAVTFAVTSGNGAVTGANATTDAAGVATVGSWTVTSGANALTATVTDTSTIVGNPVTFTATGETQAYHIDVRFISSMTPAEQAAFTVSAAKWESVIFGDVPDAVTNLPAGACGKGTPALNETVDDVVIFASIDSIDGPGNILGSAGPCFVRSGTHLPIVGAMQFDSADVATLINAGAFGLVIQHEMGHVLGFGTVWKSDGLLATPSASGSSCDSTKDPHFIGSQGLAAFDQIGGATYVASAKVPVENRGGSGTCDGHWRESVFKNELMTGFLNVGSNPLSLETVASIGDLGYLVTYSAADPYVLSAPPVMGLGKVIVLGNDIMQLPIRVVDAAGRVIATIPP